MSADDAPPAGDAPAVDAPAPVFYKISTSDGSVFRVEKACLMLSKTLSDCAINLGYEAGDAEERDPIPLMNVSKETFEQVLAYMEHHKGEEYTAPDPLNFVMSDWDAEFVKITDEQMYHLVGAANFLDIKGLMDITCKTVANMIQGKSPEEMREIWNIPTDEEVAEMERAEREANNE